MGDQEREGLTLVSSHLHLLPVPPFAKPNQKAKGMGVPKMERKAHGEFHFHMRGGSPWQASDSATMTRKSQGTCESPASKGIRELQRQLGKGQAPPGRADCSPAGWTPVWPRQEATSGQREMAKLLVLATDLKARLETRGAQTNHWFF